VTLASLTPYVPPRSPSALLGPCFPPSSLPRFPPNPSPHTALFPPSCSPTQDEYLGSGDVKYHLGTSYNRPTVNGKMVHLSLVGRRAGPARLCVVYARVFVHVKVHVSMVGRRAGPARGSWSSHMHHCGPARGWARPHQASTAAINLLRVCVCVWPGCQPQPSGGSQHSGAGQDARQAVLRVSRERGPLP
jgi:hypothetical protein